MSLLLVPSFIAICLKLAIFFRYQQSLRRENFALCMFFGSVFIWNLIELIFLDSSYSDQINFLLLIAAYCSIIFVIHAFLCIAIEYSQLNLKILPQIKAVLNIVLGYLVISLIFDREFISGFELSGISLTKIAGERYWLFQVYFLVGIVSALVLLACGKIRLKDNIQSQRCLILLLATVPAASVGVSVVIFQALEIQATSTVFQSLGFSIMLGIMVYAEESSRLFKLLTFIPFTKERKLHKKILNQITNCVAINDDPARQQPINLKLMIKEFESLVVDHVLDYYDGNQKLAASALGVSEATISRRARAASRQSSPEGESGNLDDADQIPVRITQ
ncbi:MAG: hypothetical protein RL839_01570 [Gammaproteobacteria bacterium]